MNTDRNIDDKLKMCDLYYEKLQGAQKLLKEFSTLWDREHNCPRHHDNIAELLSLIPFLAVKLNFIALTYRIIINDIKAADFDSYTVKEYMEKQIIAEKNDFNWVYIVCIENMTYAIAKLTLMDLDIKVTAEEMFQSESNLRIHFEQSLRLPSELISNIEQSMGQTFNLEDYLS